MRSGLLTLMSMVLLVWNAFAQDKVDQSKYEIIRETINFLATDKTVSQDTNFRISCETLDYDCFTQQLSSKKPITGIDRWYNRWRSTTVTDTAKLIALRNRIFADIFERSGKEYRKQLAGYEGYISRIQQLIDQNRNAAPVEEVVADTSMTSSDSLAGVYPASPEQLTEEIENPEKDNPMIAYLALVLGIIALAIAAMPFLKKKEEELPADFESLAERMDELALRMQRLERKATDSQDADAMTTLTEIMESVERRVVELESDKKPKP